LESPKRQCGSCTACCEGWLTGQAYEYAFYPGRPCHFKGKGCCSIYPDRPENPCKGFECVWLSKTLVELPEWMRPDLCGSIVLLNEWQDKKYALRIFETGKKIDSTVLSWFVELYLVHQVCISYQIQGVWHHIGPEEYKKHCETNFN
jgi:hypothetical protein